MGDQDFRSDAGSLMDPSPTKIAPVGGVVLADGDLDRPASGKRLELLEDALAVGMRANHGRAMVVLEGRRDDLRGRGCVVVDQDNDRNRSRYRAARGGQDC